MNGILCTTIHAGAGLPKQYAVEKFLEMAKTCMPNEEWLVVVDRHSQGQFEPHGMEELLVEMPNTHRTYATDIVYAGKGRLIAEAEKRGYDAILWQGIDCYYATLADWHSMKRGFNGGIYGAVVAGRNRPDYPVCRKFKLEEYNHYLFEQEEWPEELTQTFVQDAAVIENPGYVGSDATLIGREVWQRVSMKGYLPWPDYDFEHAVGPEEFFMHQALKLGIMPLADWGILPWHVHETGLAVRFPGQTADLNELNFSISPKNTRATLKST